jgi:hypothetical protein
MRENSRGGEGSERAGFPIVEDCFMQFAIVSIVVG